MSVSNGSTKYDAKTAQMTAAYQAGIARAPARWAERLSAAGAPAGPTRQAAYQAGLQRGAPNYGAAVAGKGAYWAQRFREAMAL